MLKSPVYFVIWLTIPILFLLHMGLILYFSSGSRISDFTILKVLYVHLQADVSLTFQEAPAGKEEQDQYAKKPEIKVRSISTYRYKLFR